MTKRMPVISIVGRPNVGKSSLFNRVVGKRHAVVEKREGTTRDRIEKPVKTKGKIFILADTGGFLPHGTDEIRVLVKAQIEKAVLSSDALLFVCDGEKGLLPLDMDLASRLRKSGKKIILVINKIDNEKRKEDILDFYRLGLGEPFGISCLHNLGIKQLLDKIVDTIPLYSEAEIEKYHPIKIAICGRPNVGKSSFLNKVLDRERVIVHEKPGTTRDSIDTYFKKDGIMFLLIDTAGIRHRRKVKEAVDIYSMMRARDSIDRSDVAVLLIDGMEGVTNDDIKIFDYINERGKGCVIVVNKWDLVKDIEMAKYRQAILKRVPEARNFPIAFISAKTGRNVLDAFNLVKAIKTNLDLFIDTDTLNDFLKEIKPQNVSVPRRRKYPKFYHMAQVETFPKRFLVFVNDTRAVTAFHTAFIENRLRESVPLKGVPVRIIYKRQARRQRKDKR
ncbi:MAG: ribosome biogenesis GTPase Der [Candidatus Omnitrophota bacterium]|nr:MAG: ribosome biogenesis GTPase Der [Candidatus Omnitrophota bacterium]